MKSAEVWMKDLYAHIAFKSLSKARKEALTRDIRKIQAEAIEASAKLVPGQESPVAKRIRKLKPK